MVVPFPGHTPALGVTYGTLSHTGHLKVYEGVYSIWEILEPSFFFLNKVRGDT